LRGVGGDVIICDEAAYIHANTLFDVVVPLLTIERAAWISLSTINKERHNPFNLMMKQTWLKTMVVSLACDSCRAGGATGKCRHREDDIPPWSSVGAREFTKQVYGTLRQDTFERETMGVDDDAGPYCFNELKVNELFSRPRVALENKSYRHVFVMIDPAGGSDIREKRGSDFAIVSFVQPGFTIVGAEAIDVLDPTEDGYKNRVAQHIERLQQVPQLRGATFVVIIENNFGTDWQELGMQLQRRFAGHIYVLAEKNNKGGVCTTPQVKQASMEFTRKHLIRDEIRFADCFVTTHEKPERMLDDWQAQFKHFREHKKPSDTPYGKGRIAYSGKDNGPDDLVTVTQLGAYWMEQFWDNPKFKQYHV
jgi:hypothetical protein